VADHLITDIGLADFTDRRQATSRQHSDQNTKYHGPAAWPNELVLGETAMKLYVHTEVYKTEVNDNIIKE
jgi:hypothetical protein